MTDIISKNSAIFIPIIFISMIFISIQSILPIFLFGDVSFGVSFGAVTFRRSSFRRRPLHSITFTRSIATEFEFDLFDSFAIEIDLSHLMISVAGVKLVMVAVLTLLLEFFFDLFDLIRTFQLNLNLIFLILLQSKLI